jgi:hypothetical protein
LTWSAPTQVNKVPSVQAFTASVDVADDGTIGVTYYDFRKDSRNRSVLFTNYWQITSSDGGASWVEVPLAGRFNMRTAPNGALGYFLGDYEGLAHSGNTFVPFFARANFEKLANRTDVLSVKIPKGLAMGGPASAAAMQGDEDDAPGDGHVEVNAKPLPIMERLKSRRWERQLR